MRKIGFLLVIVLTIAACSHSEPAPTATTPPLKPTATKPPTSTPAPSPTSTPSPTPTATPAPLERITYPVGHAGSAAYTFAIITFSNSDGTGLEYSRLFEPFSDSYLFSLKFLAWSPDGRFLAFDGATAMNCDLPEGVDGDCNTNYGLFIADYSQSAIIQHIEDVITNASWSPDSRHLVMSIYDRSESRKSIGDLYILDVESGQLTPVTSGPSKDLYPAWSPDGEWIAFVRFDPGPGCGPLPNMVGDEKCHLGSLYRIRPDGSDLQLLYESVFINNNSLPRVRHDAPAWSPDSQWLAFLTRKKNVRDRPDISILNVETGEWQLVAGEPAAEMSPNWSPDGQKLAFVSWDKRNPDIYLWDMHEQSITNLTKTVTYEYYPVWSLSGAYIAFISDNKLSVINADGTNRVLINKEDVPCKPAWQPGVYP